MSRINVRMTRPLAVALLIASLAAVAGCRRDEPPAAPKPAAPAPAVPDAPLPAPAPPPPSREPIAPAPVTPAPAKAVEPFNGRDLAGWEVYGNKKFNAWIVGAVDGPADASGFNIIDAEPADAHLVQPAAVGVNIYTEREFADCLIELEAMIPPGGNSGIYLMGEYELQILDDPDADTANPTDMDFGAIARLIKPLTYAKDGHGWQKFEIDFRAPRFDAAGEKTANAKLVSVKINGKLVHENAEIVEPTAGGLYSEDRPEGPLMLQGNEGPAAFRNIRITPR